MTREELKQEVQKWVNGADRYQMNLQSHLDHATDEIMKLVDKYLLTCVMEEKEINVNKIEPGQPLFTVPTCPICGNTKHKIYAMCSVDNCQCLNCGSFFTYNFYNSI